ncbi:hypothetical protein [Fangia hongkongensis]|uniref:hypothetical protein n=1 Tax=Fangia hongkongensis TaxID=270495 RepID=UPI000366CA4E|nr:hypothetical protein [Fangia hongkongensis]MBK2125041.1 hypothetical protein [Fangia hongkongensis]
MSVVDQNIGLDAPNDAVTANHQRLSHSGKTGGEMPFNAPVRGTESSGLMVVCVVIFLVYTLLISIYSRIKTWKSQQSNSFQQSTHRAGRRNKKDKLTQSNQKHGGGV